VLKIAGVESGYPVFLAPMAGVTDMPFRVLCREQGCGLVCTEMVSAKGMYYGDLKTHQLTYLDSSELPAAVQIFGSEPDIMAEAARILNDSNAAFIDINMGCPTPKIVKNGEGSALMRNPALAGRIVRAVVNASKKPVTVKIRKGWDEDSVNAVEIARISEENGAAAVTVHGRTRQQFYGGKADWSAIREVKRSVSIPVIGNGDINGPADAKRMINETGCDAVMVGRAARGNPWIFKSIRHYLETGRDIPEPSAQERIEMLIRHLELMIGHKGERTGIMQMRKHIAWYVKGMKNATQIRQQVFNLQSKDEIINIIKEYSAY
jgi:tRNA-dihydrouridine synthase B